MKLAHLVLGVLVLLILVLAINLVSEGRLSSSLDDGPKVKEPDYGAINMSTDMDLATSTNDIPIYPGARQVVENSHTKPGASLYRLESSSTIEDVTKFYRSELGKSGWRFIDEAASPDTVVMDFEWINQTKTAPRRRYLEISVNEYDGGTDIAISFERWPDANRVPLLPDATPIEDKWVVDPEFGYQIHVVTYRTTASSTEVEVYYRTIMAEEGWSVSETSPNPMVFTYSRLTRPLAPYSSSDTEKEVVITDSVTATGSLIKVFVHARENGETDVELRISGTEVKPPSE